MSGVLMILAGNALVATALLGIGLLADRYLRWPALRHLIWTAVLLQLLLPPVLSIGISLPPGLMTDMAADRGDEVAEQLSAPLSTNASADASANEATGEATGTVTGEPGTAPMSTIPFSPLPYTSTPLTTALFALEWAGAGFFIGLALIRLRRMSTLMRATANAPADLEAHARRLSASLGLRRMPRLRITSERVVPMLVALPFPTIVFSKPLIDSLDEKEIDALLCHELAHAKRGDAWLRPVELVVTAIYWWLPTLWIARSRLRRAEEAACDALVVGANAASKRSYAEGLLKTIEFTTPAAAATFSSGSADGRQIKERITMILKSSNTKTPRGALALTAGFALLAILVGPTWAPAQPADEAPPPTSPAAAESETSGWALERELIQARLEAYEIENRIQRVELDQEMVHLAEGLEVAETDGSDRSVTEFRRSIERLELERERLDVDMHIHRLETQMALRDIDRHESGGSGAPVPADSE